MIKIDRTIEIRAARSAVFRFFHDAERWARMWGAGSTIDARVGGAILLVYPDGSRASGAVTELVDGERLAFTFGYEGAGKPIAPGGSLVTVDLADAPLGTRVTLVHEVADETIAKLHVFGWRYQLARLATLVGEDSFSIDSVTAWFEAWNETDAAKARAQLAGIVATDVRFRDANGDVYGIDELAAHFVAVRRFMPGLRLEMRGPARRAHDLALADWAIVRGDGSVAGSGTNVFRFMNGRIADVVGVAAPKA
jgi:uncharacterized protein YndB with AHSA1/START domain